MLTYAILYVLQASCRAASVLSHILKDNVQCKERVFTLFLFTSFLQHDTFNSTLNHRLPSFTLAVNLGILNICIGSCACN